MSFDPTNPSQSIESEAISVLTTCNAEKRAARAHEVAQAWFNGDLSWNSESSPPVPDRPGRPEKPELLMPREMPRRRIGSLEGRIALLHAIAHIELNAIDLAFDMVARFKPAHEALFGDAQEFIDDWIKVGEEEAKHFSLLQRRLADFGCSYGALPAHDGLWQAALDTDDDWLARLAVVHMVLEARGLDVSPNTIQKLRELGDFESADILDLILEEEIGHVGAGVKWFNRICGAKNIDPAPTFQNLVETKFNGQLKPPFNEKARNTAGLLPIFYRALSK